MNGRRHTIALLAGTALLALVPLSADTSAELKTKPWPNLLGADPATADAAVAQMQDRAKAVLANLLEQARRASNGVQEDPKRAVTDAGAPAIAGF